MASLFRRGINKFGRIVRQKTTVFRSPLRAAVIGFGAIAPEHLHGYEASGIARVIGVSDLSPQALGMALDDWPSLRAYRDYKQMLAELRPDVVSVCTWPQTHAEIVAAVAAAGVKGILCEKPLALRMDELEKMLAACDQARIKLACGHQYRFHPNFVRVAELVRQGAVGKVRQVRGNILSTLANNGPHLLDTVRFVLGDPRALTVRCRCERKGSTFNRAYPAEEAASGEVIFEGGVSFAFQTGSLSPNFFSITIQAENGEIEVTPKSIRMSGAPELSTSSAEGYRAVQFGEFIRWVKGRRSSYPADGDSSARTAELVLALYEAARVGSLIELPLQNKGDVIRQLYPDSSEEHLTDETPVTLTASPTAAVGDNRLAMDGGRRVMSSWFSNTPTMGRPEIMGLARVILSKQLNSVDGHMVRTLEREFAALYGSPHAVASTSGTAALHVALATINPDPCSEVITTPMTDMGSVIPILACNCIPIFADIDPVTGNMTAESIACRITPRTKAVILVHLFGRPAELGPICDLLREKNIPLIEDCSQAHYAEYRGKRVGTYGDFGCFSLQQSKQITCGDGGLTLVNRADLMARATLFVDKGWDRKHGLRAHRFLGMNYRMTELQAAVALAQLHRLAGLIQARQEAADRLTQALRQLPGILPPSAEEGVVPSWWQYLFNIDEDILGFSRDDFADALRVEGVKVVRQYVPQPVFEYDVLRNQETYGNSHYPFNAIAYQQPDSRDYPGFQEFCNRMLLIRWSHHARDHHVETIAAAVRKVAALLPKRAPAVNWNPALVSGAHSP